MELVSAGPWRSWLICRIPFLKNFCGVGRMYQALLGVSSDAEM